MLQDDNFSWSVRLKKSRQGNYYGKEEQLEPTTNTGQTSQYINTEIKYKTQNSFVKSETTAGIRDYSFDINKVDYDASKYSAYSSSAFDFNYYNTYTVAETTYYANEQHTFKKYHNNQIVLNYGVEYTKIRDNHFWSNLESFAFANPGDALIAGKYSSEVALLFPQSNQYLQDGIHRTTLQAGLEDTYNINEQTDLTIGARYSKESDLSNNLYDYRIGLVSRWMNDKLITKLMYSTGFRAPNFSELYTRPHINFEAGNDQIVPEQIKSYEAMLIYKPNSIHRFSINGYFSSFDNIIDLDQNHASISGYTQYQGRISKGLEAEYAYTPSITHEFSVNASFNQTTYINTDDVSISQDMPDVSPVMYKAWYLYRPTNQLSMGIKYQYIGKTTQNDATNRVTSLPSQQKTDLNLKYKISKETSVDFYLDNILNATQRMPTYFYHDVRANYGITNDGMVREGRNFIAEITHKF